MKNPGARDFHPKKKKNPGYRDLQGRFFGRYAPDQNIDLRPNGGALMASLGGGEFAVRLWAYLFNVKIHEIFYSPK